MDVLGYNSFSYYYEDGSIKSVSTTSTGGEGKNFVRRENQRYYYTRSPKI